jgi:hypothetical protein
MCVGGQYALTPMPFRSKIHVEPINPGSAARHIEEFLQELGYSSVKILWITDD